MDGVGIEKDASGVVLLISDHLPWDAAHLSLLRSKIESYVNAAVSGGLVKAYPEAVGMSVNIRIMWQHEPTPSARRFLDAARVQVGAAGPTLSDGPLPPGYQVQ